MTLYAARGLEKDQISEALEIGLHPQVIIKPSHNNEKVIGDFYRFIREYEEVNGLPMKITTHGKGEFVDTEIPKVEESIKAVVKLNERYGKNIVKEVNFHAGATLTHEEGYRRIIDAFDSGLPSSGIESTFSAEEYCATLRRVKAHIKEKYDYGKNHDLDVIVENVGQVNFATKPFLEHLARLGVKRNYIHYDNEDERWDGGVWIPEAIQLGDVGCGWDMADIMPEGGKVCIDIEHLDQTREYSEFNNFENTGKIKPNDRYEEELLDKYGIFVRRGLPVLFKEPLDLGKYFDELEGRIKLSHLGGQVSMFYYDTASDGRAIRKIGSHMPITFEDDPNEFIKSNVVRKVMGRKRERKIGNYISLLKKAGCEDHVLEINIANVYTGPKWKKYVGLSRDNVKKFL